MSAIREENRLSIALHVISILAIASAFFGFLVVNIYLATFGFWDFNFLKTEYFSAGSLFLFCSCFPAGLFYVYFLARDILRQYSREKPGFSTTLFVTFAKFGIFVICAWLSSLIFMLPISSSNVRVNGDLVLFLSWFWTGVSFVIVWALLKSRDEIRETKSAPLNPKNIATYFAAHVRFLLPLVLFPFLVVLFSLFLYPAVPRYFGGGKPVAVGIYLNNESQVVAHMGITNPVSAFLIYQSSDVLLILTENGPYQVRQADVAYIKYLETSASIKALQGT